MSTIFSRCAKRIAAAAALVVFAAALFGCADKREAEQSVSFFAMDTYMSIKAYHPDKQPLDDAAALISRLEEALSVTREGSDIARVNAAAGASVAVGSETAELLALSLYYCERTGGALDLTIYPALREWGFTTGEYAVPDKTRLAELAALTDYSRVKIEGSRVTLPQGFMLDMGSVAKGYAADKTAGLLKESGVTSALINLGGCVGAIGEKPDGSPWRVAVRDPQSEELHACVIELRDAFAVTSGGYERCFYDGGTRYCHIIDPATAAPADNGTASVTIVGENALCCDALSTALFVMGAEKALSFWREEGSELGFEMILITDDGAMYITEGLKDKTQLPSDREITIVQK